MKLGQANIFSSVCQEFCPQWGSTWAGTPLGRYTPPRAGIPPGQVHPQAGTPPMGRYTPHGQVRTTPMVNERAVRILLECILVTNTGICTRSKL